MIYINSMIQKKLKVTHTLLFLILNEKLHLANQNTQDLHFMKYQGSSWTKQTRKSYFRILERSTQKAITWIETDLY